MNELCDREWPEKAFQSTQITGGNPLTIDPENLGIYAETEKLDKGLENRFRERFPDLERVESEEAQAKGEVGVLKMTSQRIDKNTKERIIKERVVFKMVHNKKEETESDISVIARNMKCLRNTMTKEGRYNIAMPIPEIGNPSQIRKMIECIFNKSDISISLYTNRQDYLSSLNVRAPDNKRRKEEFPALILEAKGKSYVELLKEVRSKMEGKEAGKNVKGVRMTKKGDMLITLNKKEHLKDFEEEMRNKMGDVTMRRMKNNEETIFIYDLDAVTTEEEVKVAIEEAIGSKVFNLVIRNAPGERKMAIVSMERSEVQAIIEIRRIRIGWNWCRVKEKISIDKCFKCLKHGHRARECTGPDRSKSCLKYGSGEHKVENCQANKEYCCDCGTDGHRNGSGNCPNFRKMIIEKRRMYGRSTSLISN